MTHAAIASRLACGDIDVAVDDYIIRFRSDLTYKFSKPRRRFTDRRPLEAPTSLIGRARDIAVRFICAAG